MSCHLTTRTSTAKGTAATELAIAIPILMLFALACADFGRIAFFDEVVSNAARTGADTGASHGFTDYTRPDWQDDVEQAVLDEMANIPDFDAGKMSYSLSTTTDADDMTLVTVDVSYPFETVVDWPLLPSEVTLQQRCVSRQFR